MQTTPEATGTEPVMTMTDDRPFGPVAAVFLAAGIGAVVLGVLTTLAEASDGIGSALQWADSIGPLIGKTILTAIAFAAAWAFLHVALRGKDPDPRRVFFWAAVLVVVGLVLTFPVFFQLFEPAA
jgi:uncharacterized membrane protein YidH (DUF202 family)